MGKLDQRVAIVTGGGTGIGEAIALEFARAGADVVVCGRSLANLDKVTKEIKALGRQSLGVVADVRIAAQVNKLVKQTVDKFGKIDILVNNAGITRRARLLDMTEQDWDDVLDTDLKAVFLCTQAAARHMAERKYGKIINIASFAGMGRAFSDIAGYCTAKAGVVQLTKNSARELGPYGINVNAISPGAIVTALTYSGRTPEQVEQYVESSKKIAVIGRVGTTQDVASLALFLASDDSSFISGDIISVDGGRIDRM